MIKNRIIFRKIKHDIFFDIQQIVEESHFTVKGAESRLNSLKNLA